MAVRGWIVSVTYVVDGRRSFNATRCDLRAWWCSCCCQAVSCTGVGPTAAPCSGRRRI